jgi:hypothetical protein
MSDNGIDEYIDAIRSYIIKNNEIIKKLTVIKHFVEICHWSSNCAKTTAATGGVIATIATAGAVFAPITGGASLLLSGVAVAGAGVSAMMGITGSIADKLDENANVKSITACQNEHESNVKRLETVKDQICQKINQLIELFENKIDLDVATFTIFSILTKTSLSALSAYTTFNLLSHIKDVIQIENIQAILLPTGISITRTLQYNQLAVRILPEQLARFTEVQRQAYISVIKDPKILLGETVTTMGKLSFVAQVFFSVTDIALLIKSWTTNHYLVKPIDQFIESLENDAKRKTATLCTIQEVFGT